MKQERKAVLRVILLSIQNNMLSEAISRCLRSSGDTKVTIISPDRVPATTTETLIQRPQILLMEVSFGPASLEERLKTAREVRRKLPSCRIALLCDERSSPELARGVTAAKQQQLVDAFFYSSVSLDYLRDALSAI